MLNQVAHITDALKKPHFLRPSDDTVLIRFEIMKVASAVRAVERLMESGTLNRGDTVIDSSSGIYALSLALACHKFDLRCYIVGSTAIDATTKCQLELLGVQLEQVPPTASLKLDQSLRVQRIQEILSSNPNFHWMQQYHDPLHYEGYASIARSLQEIFSSSRYSTADVIGGVGSGASTGGIVRELQNLGVPTRAIGIQPFGSITFGSEHIQDPDILIAGIGSSIPFGNVDHRLYDEIHFLSFLAAQSGAIDLLRQHAAFAGLSSGAAHLVGRHAREHFPNHLKLIVLPDTGHRYAGAVFAGHKRVRPVEEFTPYYASDRDDLKLPWSVLDRAGLAY